MNEMFCFQCEQTAGGRGCTLRGVCGKQPSTSHLQDILIGELVSLSLSGAKRDHALDSLVEDALFSTLTNVDFDDQALTELITRVRVARGAKDKPFDLASLWKEQEDLRSLKSLLLFGIKGIAAYACHARVLGSVRDDVDSFFYKGLALLAKDAGQPELLEAVMEAGRVNLSCMEMLNDAHRAAFGTPKPATVSKTVEKGPFVIVSGHDLRDLELLLRQTEGKGISVYTHGEMLPAHAYPKLRRFTHLKGHFGTAWQNQQKEFSAVPAAILFTTNCIMPVRESYADRVFTTGVVQYPGMTHIGTDKDFSAVINKALQLGGYEKKVTFPGINGGSTLTTGFGSEAVLSHAEAIIEAVKAKKIRHFFLVGGCDGARPGRNYYTEFVKQTPADTVVLTLACGKFRFNDLDLGTIDGIPRLLDMGQCNDAFGAIKVALALADAFKCGVNDLPLTLVLSWYEQKAVAILLTLLALGLKHIYLGPSLPAFLSPAVLDVLVKEFGVLPEGDPIKDMDAMLSR